MATRPVKPAKAPAKKPAARRRPAASARKRGKIAAGITAGRLTMRDAHDLSPLIAAYVQEFKRGAPRRPDDYYAELLFQDRTAEILGAWLDGRLVGFAVFYDQPDSMTGHRRGQLDDLFVIQDARDRGIVRSLVAALLEEGKRRGWDNIRWLVPEKTPVRDHIAEEIGSPGRLKSFVIPVGEAGER
jgi:GNAT superfamily N-acetyltransferase